MTVADILVSFVVLLLMLLSCGLGAIALVLGLGLTIGILVASAAFGLMMLAWALYVAGRDAVRWLRHRRHATKYVVPA